MISCLLVEPFASNTIGLAQSLEAAGIHVLGAVPRSKLVQEAARLSPEVVVVDEARVDEPLFAALSALRAAVPKPVLMFTSDPDADAIARALEAGVDAYVVNGFAPERLRCLVHVARVRFAHEQRLRDALADVSGRFEERKLVDRAKGILMRSRQVTEEEAFSALRAASMHTNRRVGQISQQVIAVAGMAESINRAGQLRMLSQRLVKLYALQVLALRPEQGELLARSIVRVDANLSALGKNLSASTYGDMITAIATPWAALKSALSSGVDAVQLTELNELAERVLLHADRLVNGLESHGGATSLRVINICGRQRMLSQRVAKQALLALLLPGDAAAAAASEAAQAKREFDEALAGLDAAPLGTREIRDALDEAKRRWTDMTNSLGQVRSESGQRAVGESSEALLDLFEQLTERYERSMQMLMG